ncbi:hypothetical protein IG197_21220 [Aminobacter sp. SR38]|jgi:hypothetical protein|uniref:hypothetical protein n=1 Tax=Aminobacter sp. SR38 TaxID=2774562 RepID=UPI00177AF016|nr:hypothetical protein [Aminobacter sp. SR38]QOF70310.1 hypothetical protein IG197_21220 [Aminobacter sp. SR38]
MNVNKTLLTALGMTVAMAFSAPVLTASSANAAGYTVAPAADATTTTKTVTPLVKKVASKKPTHKKVKKHKKHVAPAATTKKTTM